MKKLLLVSGMMLLFLLALTSAIDMQRVHTFEIGETQNYKFLEDNYTIRVMDTGGGGSGSAEVSINSFRHQVSRDTPLYWEDLTVRLEEVTQYNATLSLEWFRDDEEPDDTFYLSRNMKQDVEAEGRTYSFLFKETNTDNTVAEVEIEGNDYELRMKEKKELEDGTKVKLNRVTGGSPKRIELYLWASGTDEEEEPEESYDVEKRVSAQQQIVLEAKGARIPVKIIEITPDRNVRMNVDGEEVVLGDGNTKSLKSGIVVKASQVALTLPKSVLVSLKVPDSLGSDSEVIVVDRTYLESQKDMFEREKYIVRTELLEVTNETATIRVNGEDLTLEKGESGMSGDIEVKLRLLAVSEYTPKAIFRFFIPKQAEKKPEPEEEEEEPEMNETEEVNESVEMNEIVEVNETQAPEPEPEPEVNETGESQEPEGEEPSLGNTISNFFRTIGNFFSWLVK